MHSFQAVALLALAGSAIAAPAPRHRQGGNGGPAPVIVYETVVHTVVATEYAGFPAPTPAPEPFNPINAGPEEEEEEPLPEIAPPPAPEPIAEPIPEPQPIFEPAPEPVPEPIPEPIPQEPVVEPAPAPAPAPAPNSGYMAIVHEYRVNKMGLSELKQDSQLEANAHTTAAEGNGSMIHQLLQGTMGQVLAPGGPGDFKHVFVGGWLCEIPTLPGLNGECSSASNGWDYQGQTGHAELLSNPDFTKIGCANAGGIWSCDLS